MKIQTVTVEIHEKRAHPSKMGHYDTHVSYTAEVEEGENPERVAERITFVARQQVAAECDRWEAEIKAEQVLQGARGDLRSLINQAKHTEFDDSDTATFGRILLLLPVAEHAEWRTKLAGAQSEFKKAMQNWLEELITDAGKKALRPSQIDDWNRIIIQLPEDERPSYTDRLIEAKATFDATKKAVLEGAENA